MLKEICKVNCDDYINFLFYGPDIESSFSVSELTSAFRNKYNRLYTALPSKDLYQKSTSYLLFKEFYSTIIQQYALNNKVNEKKLRLINKLFESSNYKRLVYNDYISISFVEMYIESDDEWNNIKNEIYELLEKFINYIHDDSKDSYRILSFDIPLINYNFKDTKPDLTNYNIDIISSYLYIMNNYPLSHADNCLTVKFTQELINFLNTGKTNLFNKELELDIENLSISNMKEQYLKLLSYQENSNIYLLIKLQYTFFESILKNYSYFKNDECSTNKLLYTFVAFDIILYNKSRDITNLEDIEKIFSIYNFLVIKLQDIIDELSNDNINKKTFVFMYRNQLYKSRNKIQERMKNNG